MTLPPTIIRKVSALPDSKKASDIVAIIDGKKLHNYILKKVGNELQYLGEDCYYPKIANIFKELLHITQSNEKELIAYSRKYLIDPKWKLKDPKLLLDPNTILTILIAKDFVQRKDREAALAAFNLLSLRFYTNRMHLHISYCNPSYFRSALEKLSHNHLYNTKKTIGETLLYLSNEVFVRYFDDLKNDNYEGIVKMIYYIRSRIAQSVRSFANKYYEVSVEGSGTRHTSEDMEEKINIDEKIRRESEKIAKNVTVYSYVDNKALDTSRSITKFNRKYASNYVQILANPKYSIDLELVIKMFIKSLPSIRTNQLDYIKTSKKLMSIKHSTKTIYYKKILTKIHDSIIIDAGLAQKFSTISNQSKHISRSFLSYYIALLVHSHFND